MWSERSAVHCWPFWQSRSRYYWAGRWDFIAPVSFSLGRYKGTHFLHTTLRELLTNVKDKDKLEDRQAAVYKIKCCDCQASYVGETGRNLSTRLTEHKRATRNGDVNNHIAEHHLQTKHQIDWDCDMYYVFYRLLSTTYFRKLVY